MTNEVKIFSKEGTHLHTIGKEGREVGMFHLPKGIILTKNLELIIVSNNKNCSLQIYFCKNNCYLSFNNELFCQNHRKVIRRVTLHKHTYTTRQGCSAQICSWGAKNIMQKLVKQSYFSINETCCNPHCE